MSYEGPGSGYRDEYRLTGEPGFRQEPDFRGTTSALPAYQPTGAHAASDDGALLPEAPRRTVSEAELDDVFDDPFDGQPGMDRMAVHAIWEAILLAALAGAAYLLYHRSAQQVTGSALHHLLLAAAGLGLVTTGLALSLRAASVNLAVGPIAAASAYFFASHSGKGTASTIAVTLAFAGGLGLVVGLVVAVLQVPAWAASLGGAAVTVMWIDRYTTPATVASSYQPIHQAYYWFAGFAVLSVLGGLLGLNKVVRRAVGRFRSIGDPALRRGGVGAVMVMVAMVGSSLFAALGGDLLALHNRVAAPTEGFAYTALALGAALLGGASAFGRRGGITGTVLATCLITVITAYATVARWNMSPYALAATAIGLGLIVTRLVEKAGTPRSALVVSARGWTDLSSETATLSLSTESTVSPASASGTTGSWSTVARSGTWGAASTAGTTSTDSWTNAHDQRWGS